jgi:hypothetical protein
MFVGAKRQNATKWRPSLFDDRPAAAAAAASEL